MGQNPPPGSGSERYRVADLTIDVGTRSVSRGAQGIPLPGLSFDLLLTLIRAAPNLVTHDELLRLVWPGLVVNRETVGQRIKLLRKALGDDAHAPRYIIGVRGNGCRLAVLPEAVPAGALAKSEPRSQSASAAEPVLTRRIGRLRSGAWVASILLVAVVGAVAYGLTRSPPQQAVGATEVPWQPSNTRSIAVLPFLSLSSGADDELIGLGISENVLHQLAQVPGLHVIARTSSFSFGSGNVDARKIGQTLNARYLLEGSVQHDGTRLRVMAQLIDAARGEHVWSMRFDEAMHDLFDVQDRIAASVAEALTGSVGEATRAQTKSRGTDSLEAWLYYQQGARWLSSRRRDDLDRGRQRFEAAVGEDPRFAAAYVGLAEAVLLAAFHDASEFWFFTHVPLSEADEAVARSAIESAMTLDPFNGDALIARGWLTRDRDSTEADFRRGLALNPNSAAGHERLARLTFFSPDALGQAWDPAKRAEAYELIDRAVQIDPLAPSVHLTQALMLLYGRSDVEGAEAAIMRSLERDPNYFPALERLGELRWCQRAYAEAIQYLEAALNVEPDAEGPKHFLIRVYLDMSDIDAAERVADTLPEGNALARLPIALARGDRAGAAAMRVTAASQIVTGLDADMLFSVRLLEVMDSDQAEPPEQLLANWVKYDWTEEGEFYFIDYLHDSRAAVAKGGLLMSRGQTQLGRLLLESALAHFHWEATTLQRGYAWYAKSMPAALAWLGRNDESLEALQRIDEAGFLFDWWYVYDLEPAFAELRSDPRFLALRARAEANALHQRELLGSMRSQQGARAHVSGGPVEGNPAVSAAPPRRVP